MQRRVIQRWLQTVQRRRKEREKEEEMVRFVTSHIHKCEFWKRKGKDFDKRMRWWTL